MGEGRLCPLLFTAILAKTESIWRFHQISVLNARGLTFYASHFTHYAYG